jgi:uncharacterized protein YceK
MKTLLICAALMLSGCASFITNKPTAYGQRVTIIGGLYKGKTGILRDDCSWFENYRIELDDGGRRVCVRIWDLERY